MRAADWIDGRTARVRDPIADLMLIDAVRAEITSLPTYGYRRAGALVNRTRSLMSMLPVNQKRFYRVMKEYCLLLPKAPKRRASSRPHDGKVAVSESNMRWCSDGFEIACENGQVVTGTFTKDCCDREIISWCAWSGRGLPGEPVPVCSPQSNGMAESFVNTFKRDYVSQMDRSTAAVVLAQLPNAFTHFNEVHPHSALKLKSPRMYRRELAHQALENDAN